MRRWSGVVKSGEDFEACRRRHAEKANEAARLRKMERAKAGVKEEEQIPWSHQEGRFTQMERDYHDLIQPAKGSAKHIVSPKMVKMVDGFKTPVVLRGPDKRGVLSLCGKKVQKLGKREEYTVLEILAMNEWGPDINWTEEKILGALRDIKFSFVSMREAGKGEKLPSRRAIRELVWRDMNHKSFEGEIG